jgi:hypothetical protein
VLIRSRTRRLPLVVLLLGGIVAARPAAAQIVGVIPLGKGEALGPTAEVARAIVTALNRGGKKKAQMAYMLPAFPPEDVAAGRKAAKLVKKAERAFQMMEYAKAGALADKALDLYKDIAKSNKFEGYIETVHLKAAAEFFDGKNPEAVRTMNDAYIVDPRSPSTKRFSPQIQDLYQQVVSEPLAPGTVALSSTPPGALVWFNHKLWGPAKGKAKVRAGLYLVRCYLPGHTLYQRWFRVQPHQERSLSALFTQDNSVEPETIIQLRSELPGPEPGTLTNQVSLELGLTQLILVGAGEGCTAERCPMQIRWARDGRWYRSKRGVYKGDTRRVVASVIGRRRVARRRAVPPPALQLAAGVRPCTLDSQCRFKETCVDGRCTSVTPFYKKWWFWTLVGAAVAGATVAIVVPLTRPDGPVIDVQ